MNLQGAQLVGDNFNQANLSNANLKDANVTRAIFTQANLSYANMTQTTAASDSMNGFQADFSNANFQHANLRHANLTALFKGANFQGANLRSATLLCTSAQQGTNGPEHLARCQFHQCQSDRRPFRLTKQARYPTKPSIDPTILQQVTLCHTVMPDGSTNNSNCSSSS